MGVLCASPMLPSFEPFCLLVCRRGGSLSLEAPKHRTPLPTMHQRVWPTPDPAGRSSQVPQRHSGPLGREGKAIPKLEAGMPRGSAAYLGEQPEGEEQSRTHWDSG